jgi:hypothetical protein
LFNYSFYHTNVLGTYSHGNNSITLISLTIGDVRGLGVQRQRVIGSIPDVILPEGVLDPYLLINAMHKKCA